LISFYIFIFVLDKIFEYYTLVYLLVTKWIFLHKYLLILIYIVKYNILISYLVSILSFFLIIIFIMLILLLVIDVRTITIRNGSIKNFLRHLLSTNNRRGLSSSVAYTIWIYGVVYFMLGYWHMELNLIALKHLLLRDNQRALVYNCICVWLWGLMLRSLL